MGGVGGESKTFNQRAESKLSVYVSLSPAMSSWFNSTPTWMTTNSTMHRYGHCLTNSHHCLVVKDNMAQAVVAG